MAATLTSYTPTFNGDVADLRGPLGGMTASVTATAAEVRISMGTRADTHTQIISTIALSIDDAKALAEALRIAIEEAEIARQQSGWNELVRTTAEARHVA